MNEKLLAPFSAYDVKKAAFSIGDLKAPGPGGIHAIFYKRFWGLCGEDITNEILQAMNTGVIPEGWNDMTVVLIPKLIAQSLLLNIARSACVMLATRSYFENVSTKAEGYPS
jgi:hypothetical protein